MELKHDILALLREWCDTLLSYTIRSDDACLDGAILCPACTVVHGRIGDVVFPMMLLYRETGEEKYYEAAKKYVAWTGRNLSREDGTLYNDVGNTWKGTTAFSALAIGEALTHFGDVTDAATWAEWESLCRRLTYACATYFEDPHFDPNINYYAGAAALFAFGYRFWGDPYLLEKARLWEQKCHGCFDENGLFFGEGKEKSPSGTTAKGCRTIDMGYNLEESIPLLLMHAVWLEDAPLIDYYTEKAKAHLHFVLPDGAIDNSFGTRHNKWTYWGSRTSDGLQEGLVLVADRDPLIARACLENFKLYRRCTHGGLLHQGPMSYTAGEPACVHHAFTHAKALASFWLHADEEVFARCATTPMPREREGVLSFQNGNLYTVTRGGWIATVNAVDAVEYNSADNGGGAISLLYHSGYGPVMAATPHAYVPTEPLNMQYQRHADTAVCQTARFVAADGSYTSDCDRSVTLQANGFSITAASAVFPLRVRCDFEEDLLRVTVLSERDGYYSLPLIASAEDRVTQNGGKLRLRDTLTVSDVGTAALLPRDGKRFFHQVGGFQYVQLHFPVKANLPTVFTLTVD
ncbi:MAG: hypothetical protein IJ012_04155 [Clostridia bacterium]|nr:hypothetical protein [Clostridia bacterium]